MESEYPFLQGQTGDTSMNTYAHGGAARPPHHTVAIIVPVAPASGGLSQGMPQEHPIMAELKQTIAGAQALMARIRQTPGVNQQVFSAGAHEIVHGLALIAQSLPRPR